MPPLLSLAKMRCGCGSGGPHHLAWWGSQLGLPRHKAVGGRKGRVRHPHKQYSIMRIPPPSCAYPPRRLIPDGRLRPNASAPKGPRGKNPDFPRHGKLFSTPWKMIHQPSSPQKTQRGGAATKLIRTHELMKRSGNKQENRKHRNTGKPRNGGLEEQALSCPVSGLSI